MGDSRDASDDRRETNADDAPLEQRETNADDTLLEPRGNQQAVIDSDAACISVDAGAGTGKTTTMLMRIEHAIEQGGVDPDDILVLTFANEAAGSIRDAVADRLDPDAAAAIDIYTYHSFCYRLVREYAYYLGYSPSFDVVTEHTRRRIVGRLLAANDYGFAAAADDGSPDDLTAAVDGFIAAMSREDITPAQLQDSLPDIRTIELCNEFVLWLERRASALSFDNEALRYFNEDQHVDAARDALVDYGKLLEYCREKIAESPEPFREDDVVRDVDRYLRVLQTCITNTIEALSLEDRTTKQLPRALFGNEIWRQQTARLEQSPVGRLKHYVEFLRLARHYAAVYADYHEALAEERALDFDELVRTATELLDDESVAAEITGQWDQVYCDEFQDTDATQFALITELTAGADRPTLLAIGDKDQAIYGWRGTDREGLDRLAARYDDHESIELELNFRSRQEILDLTNHCDYGPQSSKTLREVGRTRGEYPDPESESDGSGSPVDDSSNSNNAAAGNSSERDADGPSENDTDDPSKSDPETPLDHVVKIESDEVARSTAEQVATTVSRLLNGDAANVPRRSLADLAVIVRTNRHAQAVADALRERRIPYEISGSPRGDISPGIRTLLSYLRVLVDPDADAHLRRVLLYRYRLSEADLERLQRRRHRPDGSLYDAVFDVEPDALENPDRIERAREHLAELERLHDVYPLSGFVRRFRELTRIEWFLTSEERASLDHLERFVETYDPDAVVGTLTGAFVDALERTLRGGGSERTRGTQSADSVDVMTVHQAKGLEFDTVLVPYLSDEEWCVESDYAERAREQLLAATLEDDVESPLRADLAAETVAEEWRVLHVALTRAENHLFVFGSAYDYDGDEDELGVSTADACLADEIEWSVAGQRMDLWSSLTESFDRVRETYSETVADRTAELARAADVTPGSITYYAGYEDRAVEPLETREAIATVNRLGRLLRTGTLLPAADAASHGGGAESTDVRVPSGRRASALTADTVRFPVETLADATELPVAMRHSYSAMETHDTCPRKHYLDHVVRAIDDPDSDPSPGSDPGAIDRGTGGQDRQSAPRYDSRIVGTVFHDVAEEAFHREYRTRADWREAAIRQLTARDLLEHREPVLACIDRYFEATAPEFDQPVAAWEPLAAELPFSLSAVDGVSGDVIGYVDSIRRLPTAGDASSDRGRQLAGDLAVLDYKTTAERIDPDEAVQLSLYARACEQRFDEPIGAVGYVYVGDVAGDDPRVALFDPDELPAWSSVRETLAAVDDPSYLETTPGEHCRYCPHRSLGCAPDDIDDGDGALGAGLESSTDD